MKTYPNVAFIDSQNLYLATTYDGWRVDFQRLCIYLRDKYNCGTVYFFVDAFQNVNRDLYTRIQEGGGIIILRSHSDHIKSEKKGNVDTDIVFEMMRQYAEEDPKRQFVLVSGDGDYFRTVEHLILKERMLKVIHPSKKSASSLYKHIDIKFRAILMDVRHKVEKKKRPA